MRTAAVASSSAIRHSRRACQAVGIAAPCALGTSGSAGRSAAFGTASLLRGPGAAGRFAGLATLRVGALVQCDRSDWRADGNTSGAVES